MQKRGSSLSTLGRTLEKALGERSLSDGLAPHRARALWDQIVGDDVSAATQAEAVRGGVLFVKVRSSVWSNELTFYKADILRKLNAAVGAPVLTDIHFTVASRGRAGKDTWPDANTNRETERIVIEEPAPPGESAGAAEVGTVADRLNAVRLRAARTYAAKRSMGWLDCPRCGALFDPGAGTSGLAGARSARERRVCPLCSTLAKSAY